MLTLKVVSYYDAWLKEDKKAVLLERDGQLYDASGLFSKLEDFEINNMLDVQVLHEEEVNYCDRSIEEQKALVQKIQGLEKMFGIKVFGGIKTKHYWCYVNGISHIRAFA